MNYLPGWFPGHVAAGGAEPLTILDFLTSATSQDSANVTGPATLQAGDLLVLSDHVHLKAGAPAASVPSGFTQLQTAAASAERLTLSAKIATGAEAGAAITGMAKSPPSSAGSMILAVFRGNIPITVMLNASGGAQGTTAIDPTPQVVAASGGTPPLIVLGAYGCDAVIDPRTFTPAKDSEINLASGFTTFVNQWLAWRIYESAPADTTIDMIDEGSENMLLSRYVSVS